MDLGREIRTFTIEPITNPVPTQAPDESPVELPAVPVEAPA